MSRFTINTPETAPEGSKEILAKIQKHMGRVVNLMGAMSESPVMLKSYMTMAGLLDQGSLSPVELQTVMMTANIENNCKYCMAAHTAESLHHKIAPETVEAIRQEAPLGDPKLEALRDLTRALIAGRGVADAEVAQARAAGYSSAQILEVVTAIAAKTITNYADHLAHPELDAPFQKFAWTRAGVETEA